MSLIWWRSWRLGRVFILLILKIPQIGILMETNLGDTFNERYDIRSSKGEDSPAFDSRRNLSNAFLARTIAGIMWRIRTGAPWRDLPKEFGPWQSVYGQFNRWSAKGLFNFILEPYAAQADHEWHMIDATIIRAHQHSAGARIGEDAAIGRSVGGLTTKVHMVCDAHGNPIKFSVTEGQRHDSVEAPELLKDTPAEAVLADKGYDSEVLRDQLRGDSVTPIIPKKKNAKTPNPDFDSETYRSRHLVENLFASMKHFRAFATRYDKLKRNYETVVYLVSAVLWGRLFIN